MRQPHLNLAVVWEDPHLLELEIRASNGDFAGAARVYTTDHDLRSLSAALLTFPRSNTDHYRFDAKTPDSSAVVEFHCMSGAGHVAIRVELTDQSPPVTRLKQNTVALEIVGGGYNMARFAAQLAQMASDRIGSAELFPDD
jgi:hypothetical protein